MKLYIMKKDCLDTIKNSLPTIYNNYYTERSNQWMSSICGENPFIVFKEIPDFDLAVLDDGSSPGEIDLNNCKIIYEKLSFLSESQASDERFWAGLCNATFYDYMRKRWKYGFGAIPKSIENEASNIKTRFFYRGSGRGGFYRNTLAKCWWVGHNLYDNSNINNHFQKLDIIGSNDLSSKINELFYNFSFSSNRNIIDAIVKSFDEFNNAGVKLNAKDHIRPAMSYLNAVGGSVVIDCLSKEEISEIFSNAIISIRQGDTPSLKFDEMFEDNQTDIEASEEPSDNINLENT